MWKWLRALFGEHESEASRNDSGVLFDGIVNNAASSSSSPREAPAETEVPAGAATAGALRADQATAARQQWRIVDHHSHPLRIRREQHVRLLRVFAARVAHLHALGSSNGRLQGN